MSLTRRKVRSLTRDQETFRDDRIFWVGSDDRYAPKQYLELLRVPRVRIFTIAAGEQAQAAERVVERLQAEAEAMEADEKWALLDADHYLEGTHLTSFLSALRRADDCGIQVAISKPCFEFWLLLHLVETEAALSVGNAREAEEAVRTALGGYNKTKLREADFPIERVMAAVRKARELDGQVKGGAIPRANTSRVYLLIEAIARAGHAPTMSKGWQELFEEIQMRD